DPARRQAAGVPGYTLGSTTLGSTTTSGDPMRSDHYAIAGRVPTVAAAVAAALVAFVSASAQDYTTWQSYAGGPHSSQYTALDQINKSNVARLEVVWRLPLEQNVLFNPIVV